MKAELITHMGSDLTVVNAARVSFAKESKEFEEKDAKLISYLVKHDHWTPFAHAQITMRETVPIFVARQRFKHTIGFVYNEESRRYVDDEPSFFMPDMWRKRAENKKQGSSDEEVVLSSVKINYGDGHYKDLFDLYESVQIDQEELYKEMIKAGVAPEQARMVLPQSMYTSYYVTGSLAAWARAYSLRSKPDAQKEIRDLAIQWNDSIQPLFPVSWKALTS